MKEGGSMEITIMEFIKIQGTQEEVEKVAVALEMKALEFSFNQAEKNKKKINVEDFEKFM